MNAIMSPVISKSLEVITYPEYVIGAIVAWFILGYLIYALVKPEKL